MSTIESKDPQPHETSLFLKLEDLIANISREKIYFLPCNCYTISFHIFASICTILGIMSNKISNILDFAPDNIIVSYTALDFSRVLDINTESMTLSVISVTVVIEAIHTSDNKKCLYSL